MQVVGENLFFFSYALTPLTWCVSRYDQSDATVSCMPFPATNPVTTLGILPKHDLGTLKRKNNIPNELYKVSGLINKNK